MSSVSEFTGKSEVYAKFRPSWPKACLDYLAQAAGLSGAVCADVGCGTGIFTALLAPLAAEVYALDRNADMLEKCRRECADFSNVKVMEGLAEKTGLADHSVDVAVAAQAFHFFDPPAFQAECRRILKPGGRVVLSWNSLPEGPLADRLGELSGPKFKRGLLAGRPDMVAGFYPGDQYQRRVFANNQSQTLDMFIGRYLSSSYAPPQRGNTPPQIRGGVNATAGKELYSPLTAKAPSSNAPPQFGGDADSPAEKGLDGPLTLEGDDAYARYIASLTDIFNQFQEGGLLDHPYQSICYIGRLDF